MTLVDLGKRLLESAKFGDTEEVKLLMTSGAPFTTDWLGISPLHMAAQYGHLETAEILLRAGISRDARTKVDRTPLHIAAQEGHVHVVELLIKHGAEVDAKDMLKMTPLHWAVERGHISVMTSLLKNSADVFSLNKFDKTTFDIAEDNHRMDLIRILEKYASCSPKPRDVISKGESVQLLQLPVNTNMTAKLSTPMKIKTEPTSLAHLKNVSRAVTTNSSMPLQSTNSTSITDAASVKLSSRPILLQAKLTHIQKPAANVAPSASIKLPSSDSDEGDSSDQSCTNVLATLAALAEATAPNANISTSEAVQWLEAHGISMLPTDNSTVVTSALEGGQTIALTEAGKLALTWVKEQQGLNNNPQEISSIHNTSGNNSALTLQNSSNQKVITIVADKAQLPSIISQQTPIVVVSSQNLQPSEEMGISSSDPPVKRMKNLATKKNPLKTTDNGKVESSIPSMEEEKSKLQKELEKIKRQAAEYKAQLLQKEFEAEQYKKQLQLMCGALPKNNQ